MPDIQCESHRNEQQASPGLTLVHNPRRLMDSAEFGPIPEPASLDRPQISELVAEVNRLYRVGGLQTALAIGRYVIAACFSGDTTRVRDPRRHPNSFRELAAREDLMVTASYLFNAVAVTEQFTLLPAAIAEALPFTHHRRLLVVHDPDAKLELAHLALDRAWSTRELASAIDDQMAQMSVSRVGRPKMPNFVRAIRLLEAATTLLEDSEDWEADMTRYTFSASAPIVERANMVLAKLSPTIERLNLLVYGNDEAEGV